MGWLSGSLQRLRSGREARQVEVAEAALHALARGRVDEAASLLRRVKGHGARLAAAQFQLAELLRARDPVAAQRHYRAAIDADPAHAVAHANLGALLKDSGQVAEAARLLERALELRPDLSAAAFNLALLRVDERNWREADRLLAHYLRYERRDAEGQYWRGNALLGLGDAEGARGAYAAALRAQPQHPQARWGLAMAQLPVIAMSDSEQQEGVRNLARELDALRQWVQQHPKVDSARAVGAQQPFFLAYDEQDHCALLEGYGALCASLMAAWARRAGVPAPAQPRAGKLRVGIVSAHVQRHSVWDALVRGWVEYLAPGRFDLQLFHTGATRDGETQWAARRVTVHHAAGDWTAWARRIAEARLDVLVYPEIGMDATTLRLASLRLARLQLAAWGHPLTTGLPTIDAFVSAAAFEPEGAQAHYSERLIALPRLGCAYRPYGTTPEGVDLARWGVQQDDRVLVCPGMPFKYAPRHDPLLVEVARRCAPCKLVFFRPEHDAHAQRLQQRLRGAFAAARMDYDSSVVVLPWQSQAAFFGVLQGASVCLDTPGFSGFNTVMQAVECATPIVAWEGRFLRGRFAAGVLRALGLSEWIADSPQAYVEKVARLCAQPQLRAAVAQQMRERRQALYDDRDGVEAFAAEIERLAAAR